MKTWEELSDKEKQIYNDFAEYLNKNPIMITLLKNIKNSRCKICNYKYSSYENLAFHLYSTHNNLEISMMLNQLDNENKNT